MLWRSGLQLLGQIDDLLPVRFLATLLDLCLVTPDSIFAPRCHFSTWTQPLLCHTIDFSWHFTWTLQNSILIAIGFPAIEGQIWQMTTSLTQPYSVMFHDDGREGYSRANLSLIEESRKLQIINLFSLNHESENSLKIFWWSFLRGM